MSLNETFTTKNKRIHSDAIQDIMDDPLTIHVQEESDCEGSESCQANIPEKESDMPEFMYESMMQHQIQYKGPPLYKSSNALADTNVVLEDIYFNSEKIDPMLNSISFKFKEEEKHDIKHYLRVTKKIDSSNSSYRLLPQIETGKPSGMGDCGLPHYPILKQT